MKNPATKHIKTDNFDVQHLIFADVTKILKSRLNILLTGKLLLKNKIQNSPKKNTKQEKNINRSSTLDKTLSSISDDAPNKKIDPQIVSYVTKVTNSILDSVVTYRKHLNTDEIILTDLSTKNEKLN
jgi:hypothetical protein